jgi:hypothetical protein
MTESRLTKPLTNSELSENTFPEQVYKMYRGRMIFVIAIVALVHCFRDSNGEGLEAKLAAAQLPSAMDSNTAVYDGNDTVYILGG